MHYERRGSGKPILLIHGIGGSWKSWSPVLDELAKNKDVIAIDLPGHGQTPPLTGEVTIGTLADAVTDFLKENDLLGIDAVGSSMGARLVLELARRGNIVGAVISLDPGGFWEGWEVPYFYHSIAVSVRLVRLLQGAMPIIAHSTVGRSLLLFQLSSRPNCLSPQLVLDEMQSYAASPSFDALLYNLAWGEKQQGIPANTLQKPLVIGWGTKDRVCLPKQAYRAKELFPDALLYWCKGVGHFPHWDAPQQTVELIIRTTQ